MFASKFLSKKTDIFREFLSNKDFSTENVPGNAYVSLSYVNLFWISIDCDKCKEYLQKSFSFQKVKSNVVYFWDVYYFLLWLQASVFLK